jgi:hypothetical protein
LIWRIVKMKKMMTLNLTEQEMKVLDDLAVKKGLNKTSVLKQALMLYQLVNIKIERGEKVFIEDQNKAKSELVFL